MRDASRYLLCLLIACAPGIAASDQAAIHRLLEGEIRFEALQGHHLDALLKRDAGSPGGQALPPSRGLSRAELQLALGLGEAAAKQIAGLAGNESTRQEFNRGAWQLAQHYYHTHRPAQAFKALEKIQGDIDGVPAKEIEHLKGLAYLGVGNVDAAIDILDYLPIRRAEGAFVQYNLAAAWLQSGNERAGKSALETLGRARSDEADVLALRDMANLQLGYRYLQDGDYEQAKESFNRVRLDGPFTSQALLGSGWTSFSMGKIDRAVVAWSLLHERDAVNDTLIEAKMALPYAYSKLGAHGKAANLYAHAIELFEAELGRMDASSQAIRAGRLHRAILDLAVEADEDWFVAVSRDSAQEPFFLPLLLASEEFRSTARSLHELVLLKARLAPAAGSIAALTELAALKRDHYRKALPATNKELFAVYEKMNPLLPKLTTPPGAQQSAAVAAPEITLLQRTYDNALQAHKAAAAYAKQLPEYSRELEQLPAKLKQIDRTLESAITHTAQQLDGIALAILDRKRKQLQSYRNDALFALAESYDFATGKR